MLLIAFYTQCLDTCLTFRTSLPTHFRTFVTTYMNIFRWENLNDFTQHIVNKLQCLIISGTQYIIRYTPYFPYFIRTACTSQFRISSQSSLHVSRHIDFGNNRNVPVGSISYDFFCFFLSIETTIRLTVIFTCIMSDYSLCSL